MSRFLPSLPFLAVALLLGGGTAAVARPRVQSPDAPWNTLTTAHYRIHYPARGGFEPFAREVASRIEGVHGLFSAMIGHALAGPTDIVVQDPMATANGMTIATLTRPHVVLWTTPPDSDSELFHEQDWRLLLVTHELVHLHHLTIPARKPSWTESLPTMVRIGPLAEKCPSWVTEGYATLLEARITGSGRPRGPYRSLVLRERARTGSLPGYEGLDSIDLSLLNAPRYLVGSAFLEWLEKGRPEILKDFWKRLSSRRYRKFDGAFAATFGEGPSAAYGRFCAELSHDALELERRLQASGLREGELFTQVPGGFLRDLSVSPDGEKLLGQVYRKKDPGLVLWSLKAPLANEKAKAKRARIDPELPPEAPAARPVRGTERTLGIRDFHLPSRPRWEGQGVVDYEVLQADAEGVFQKEHRQWRPLDKAQPAPAVEMLRPVLAEGGWILVLGDRRWKLPFEPFGPLAWEKGRGRLYASTDIGGILNLVRLPFDPAAAKPFGEVEVLTRTTSAAAYPAPTPDGKAVYFVALTAFGSQIRRLDLESAPNVPLAPLAPMAPPPPGALGAMAPGGVLSVGDTPSLVPPGAEAPAAHAYRVGESHELGLREGVVSGPSGSSWLLGAGGSDILGRLNWVALAAVGFPGSEGLGPRGASAGAAWRGWAWSPSVQAFSILERPSVQRFAPVAGWDRERRGLEVGLGRDWRPSPFGGAIQLSVARERVASSEGTRVDRTVGMGTLEQRAGFNRGTFRLVGTLNGLGAWGRTDSEPWNIQRGTVTLVSSLDGYGAKLTGEGGKVQGRGRAVEAFQLGGLGMGLVPATLDANRVFQPALPFLTARGNRFTRWRAEALDCFYFEDTYLWNEGDAVRVRNRVAGIEARADVAQIPLAGDIVRRLLGRLWLDLGVHRPLDGAMKGRTVLTFQIGYTH